MAGHKFDPARAERLNDPERLNLFVPETLWAAAAMPAPHAMLDLGAGTGLLTAAFARLAPETTVYAADVSAEMLAWMHRHLPDDVAGRIVPLLSQETGIPMPDAAVDLVTMLTLYHELDDPPATLREVHRVLAPGGRLLIADWKKNRSAAHGPSYETRVSAEEIAARVAEAGFSDVRAHDVLPEFSVVTATRP